jgi:ribonuclease-3 family protein
MAVALPSLFTVKAASLDTQQRLPYNRQRTKPKKPQNPTTLSPTTTTTTTSQTLTLTATSNNTRDSSISALLSRKIQKPIREKLEETYLGYETWLPVAPKVEKPRSIYNAASLAYIGDCIYELYARRHFLFPPLTIEEYNNRVMAVVRTEAQDAMLQKLLTENYLLEEERDVLRWGKNSGSGKTRTKKRVGVAVYNSASSLETLVGYLYLTNTKRLEEIMLKLGFSCVT